MSRQMRGSRLAGAAALALLLVLPATALAMTTPWTRQFGSPGEDIAGGVAADSGGFTVAATTSGAISGQNRGYYDAVVRRYTNAGAIAWTRQFGTSNQDFADAIAADDAGLTVVGTTDGSFSGRGSPVLGVFDLFVRRYDRSGNVVWTRQFGTPEDDDGAAVAADGSGIIVIGSTVGALSGSKEPGDRDVFIRRYGRSGNVVWTKQFGTPESDDFGAVAIDNAGFTVGGGTDGDMSRPNAGPFSDAFVRRYDSAGNLLWTRQWGQPGDDHVTALAADGTGITAVGYTHADPFGEESSQAFIRRFDRAGKVVWARVFGNANSEIAYGVASDSGGLTVTGYTVGQLDGQPSGSLDVFVRRYSRDGALIDRNQFGTTLGDLALGVAAHGTRFAVVGHTQGGLAGENAGDIDIFLRRFDR